jgi:hypothetical protein
MVDVLGYHPINTGKASVYKPSRMDVKLISALAGVSGADGAHGRA